MYHIFKLFVLVNFYKCVIKQIFCTSGISAYELSQVIVQFIKYWFVSSSLSQNTSRFIYFEIMNKITNLCLKHDDSPIIYSLHNFNILINS